jgi:hypothetical protein
MTEPKIIPSDRRREKGDLCDFVKRLGCTVAWTEGESSSKLWGWEHPEYKESADLFEDAEDCAEAFMQHLAAKLADELSLHLVKEVPPLCRCGSALSVEGFDNAIEAANKESYNHARRSDAGRVETGMIVCGVMVQTVARALTRSCLKCAIGSLCDLGEGEQADASKAIKAAMLKAIS